MQNDYMMGMVRRLFFWSVAVCLVQLLNAQELKKFRDVVYESITVDKNITYADASDGPHEKFYKADVYEPSGDHSVKRPLIIWLHGGAFKFGSKNAVGTRLWCTTFAQRGYVCASINYRLDRRRPLFGKKTFYKGCYEAIQHVNSAVAFFKQNAEKYGIDTNYIILAGNSAGGMIALQYAYSNVTEWKKLIDPEEVKSDDVIEPATHIKAVINFWGAIFDDDWLHNARTPIVSVHGRKDRLVPIANKKKSMYGSYVIHKRADYLRIPNKLKVYHDHAHELHKRFIPIGASKATKRRWLEAGQFAADFLYDQLFRRPAVQTLVHTPPEREKTSLQNR